MVNVLTPPRIRRSALTSLIDWLAALEAWERAIALSLAAGDIAMAARNGANRALGYSFVGSLADAEAELILAHETANRAGNPTAKGMCDYVSGEVISHRSPTDALEPLGRAVATAQRLHNRYLGAIAGLTFVSTAARVGDPAAALDASTIGLPLEGDDAVRVRAAVDCMKDRLGADRFSQRWAKGVSMGDDDALAYARRELRVTPGVE